MKFLFFVLFFLAERNDGRSRSLEIQSADAKFSGVFSRDDIVCSWSEANLNIVTLIFLRKQA